MQLRKKEDLLLGVGWFEQPGRRILVLEEPLCFLPLLVNNIRPFLLVVLAKFFKLLSLELVTFLDAIFLDPVRGFKLRVEVGFERLEVVFTPGFPSCTALRRGRVAEKST